MKCPVCQATAADPVTICPQCKFDTASADASDSQKILALRESFKQSATAYEPEKRVTPWDRWRPWAAVALGFFFFLLWLRACSTMGRMF